MGEMLAGSQAANRLGVAAVTVSTWARRGWLPCVETPLGRLYRVEDVDAMPARLRQLRRPAIGRGRPRRQEAEAAGGRS